MSTLWEHTDGEGDTARLVERPSYAQPEGVIGSLRIRKEETYLDRAAAETLREALDRLLDVDEQQPAPAPDPGTALPSFRDLQRVVAAVADNADQLRESVAARAREFACRDAGWLAIDVQTLAGEVRGLARAIAGGDA